MIAIKTRTISTTSFYCEYILRQTNQYISVALNVKALTIFCDSPVLAYGRYSSRMITVEPEGEKDTTTHDTLGKDKISFNKVLMEAFKLLH